MTLAERLRERAKDYPYNRPGTTGSLLGEAADALEARERVLKWLDNNTTFFHPIETSIPMLSPNPARRIWYHTTTDTESYPFSAVIAAAIRGLK